MSKPRIVADSQIPKTAPLKIETKTYIPQTTPLNPGASVQPKAPLTPAETGHNKPLPPAKND